MEAIRERALFKYGRKAFWTTALAIGVGVGCRRYVDTDGDNIASFDEIYAFIDEDKDGRLEAEDILALSRKLLDADDDHELSVQQPTELHSMTWDGR